MSSAPIQKIYHVLSLNGLFFAEENAVADSPTGKSLQSLYIALPYICWVQIFLLFHIENDEVKLCIF